MLACFMEVKWIVHIRDGIGNHSEFWGALSEVFCGWCSHNIHQVLLASAWLSPLLFPLLTFSPLFLSFSFLSSLPLLLFVLVFFSCFPSPLSSQIFSSKRNFFRIPTGWKQRYRGFGSAVQEMFGDLSWCSYSICITVVPLIQTLPFLVSERACCNSHVQWRSAWGCPSFPFVMMPFQGGRYVCSPEKNNNNGMSPVQLSSKSQNKCTNGFDVDHTEKGDKETRDPCCYLTFLELFLSSKTFCSFLFFILAPTLQATLCWPLMTLRE